MADNTNSLEALMKSNARLNKNVEAAKKVVARKDYSGPEGDILVRFSRKVIMVIDSNNCVILEFRVDGDAPGQADYNGERVSLFHKLADDNYGTVESRQAELFEVLQLMGIDTVKLSMSAIDKALEALGRDGTAFTIRVIKKKGKGANAGKTYTNYKLVGINDAPTVTLPSDDGTSFSEADEDEWQDELADEPVEVEETDEVAEDEGYKPSDWVTYQVSYKPAKSPKPLVFVVKAADDAAGTVTLERDGKILKNVKYDDLILPEA
jgi:hypothetical protein